MFPARIWREIPQRYRLEANRCPQTGEIYFPPRLVCPEGKCEKLEPVKLAETGTVESFTVIRVAPSAFTDEAPYPVGIVKLDDGAKMMCQIADAQIEELKIGMKVKVEFRKIQSDGKAGVHAYGYKCVPVRD